MSKKFVLLISLILLLCISLCACSDDTIEGKIVTVNFVTNVDQFTIDPLVLGDGIDDYMPDDPVRAGYTFGGWYYDAECNHLFTIDDGISEDITLYARWQRNSIIDEPEDPVYVESGSFDYEIDGGSYYITGYHGTKAEITIPTTYNAKPVIGIRANAFQNNTLIEKITILSTLESIGDDCFKNLTKLKTIEVSNNNYFSSSNGVLYNSEKTSILQIGMASELTSFVITSKITIIRDGAFYGCTFPVTFASGCDYTALSEYDFSGFKGMLTLGSNITLMKQYGLHNFMGKLVFGDSNNITNITYGAFDGYNGDTVVLPSKITVISACAFMGCLGSVDISGLSITSLGKDVFSDYQGETLVVPSTVVTLGEQTFSSCTATITFASGCTITTIPSLCFSNFAGTVTFPVSVNILEEYAFWNAKSGAVINFSNAQANITIDDKAFNLSSASVNYAG